MVSSDVPSSLSPPPRPPPPPDVALISAFFTRRHQRSVASEILTGRLYISDLSVAHDQDGLARLGITHVVSVLEPTIAPVLGPSFTQLHVGIEDSFRTNILQHFDRTTEFIRKALADNDNCKVLVHCMMGMSRSVAVVCAYLIAEKSMTSPDAIAYVRSRRSIARPNVGFAQQLEAYAKRHQRGGEKETYNTMQKRVRTLFRGSSLSLPAESTKAKVQGTKGNVSVAPATTKVVV